MQIIITGGAGFLGQRLAKALLASEFAFEELLLVDLVQPAHPGNDRRVRCQQVDLTEAGAAQRIISDKTGIVFHLAAVVSGQAERDFELGWTVNLDLTRHLLEACRQQKPGIRFVFASGFAVFGGNLPPVVDDSTVVTPQSSYGAQKAIVELLVNDYTRKNFVDGRVLRLPTISVRPGQPNQAASSFVSSIIREPINGQSVDCPVSPDLAVWCPARYHYPEHSARRPAGRSGFWQLAHCEPAGHQCHHSGNARFAGPTHRPRRPWPASISNPILSFTALSAAGPRPWTTAARSGSVFRQTSI